MARSIKTTCPIHGTPIRIPENAIGVTLVVGDCQMCLREGREILASVFPDELRVWVRSIDGCGLTGMKG